MRVSARVRVRVRVRVRSPTPNGGTDQAELRKDVEHLPLELPCLRQRALVQEVVRGEGASGVVQPCRRVEVAAVGVQRSKVVGPRALGEAPDSGRGRARGQALKPRDNARTLPLPRPLPVPLHLPQRPRVRGIPARGVDGQAVGGGVEGGEEERALFG